VQIGQTNKTRYVIADKNAITAAKKEILSTYKKLKNKNLSEDVILEQIKRETGIFDGLKKNVAEILDYGFTEMLNNAIEHSQSKEIEIKFQRAEGLIKFSVVDQGIGIFVNIMQRRNLDSIQEAIQDLLKGKQTTAPEEHTGEGIFFTSRAADMLVISSSGKKLAFNNNLNDIFVQNGKIIKGTKVVFTIADNSKRSLRAIFREYAGNTFEFDATKVAVRLYKMGNNYISRSQARRIVSGLDKFKTVILDFANIDTVGQAFADQIFRVWHNQHPEIAIKVMNSNENINIMIKRAQGAS